MSIDRVGRVDHHNVIGGLVDVGRDILAIDGLALIRGLATEREGLEILEEAGLDAAHEGREALGGGLGAVVEDALFQGEGGADEDPLEGPGVVAPPRDVGLVVAGDGEDVPLEPALFEGGRGGVGADPVPVADPVGAGLGLAVPGKMRGDVRVLKPGGNGMGQGAEHGFWSGGRAPV